MDITTITEVVRRPPERPGADWQDGDAWLAGGTWLYSTEHEPVLNRLVDLTTLGWESLSVSDAGLEIGATCLIRELYELETPADWTAAPQIPFACESFLASWKIYNAATVGGNICMSLPAGPMITLTVALEAVYTIWTPDGGERTVDAVDFVTGNNTNVLEPGEILRKINIPASALQKRATHRRFNLTHLGRSTVFLIGTQDPNTGAFLLTITAGTTHPVQMAFDVVPEAGAVRDRIDAEIADDVWFDDPNGTPEHRRHLIRHYGEQIRAELAQGGN